MAQPIRVWDLPTRLFHWSLVALVVLSFVSVKIGGNWLTWHFYSGYALLALVGFRLVWGFVGGRYARFSSFLFGPKAIIAYLRGSPDAPRTLGHNPLGSLSVYGLLGLTGLQALGGLFANDDIASEGPLARFVSKAVSDQITSLHHLNEKFIMLLVLLHVAALMYYRFAKRENLIQAMVTGDKPAGDPAAASRDDVALRLRGLLVLAVCAALVWALLKWAAAPSA